MKHFEQRRIRSENCQRQSGHWQTRAAASLIAALSAAAVIAACGGTSPEAESPSDEDMSAAKPAGDAEAVPSDSAPEGVMASAPDKPFDAMSPPERMKYMKNTVAPHMAKVFQEFDGDAFAEFNCVTCHGPGANNGNFEMPTDSLPKLDEEEMEEHPEFTQFMKEHVVPEMATLLGEQPFDMETGQGFGCFHCHMKKE